MAKRQSCSEKLVFLFSCRFAKRSRAGPDISASGRERGPKAPNGNGVKVAFMAFTAEGLRQREDLRQRMGRG
jgi:hypothetical protein